MNLFLISLMIILSVFTSLIATMFTIKLSLRLKAVDKPGERKIHKQDTPNLGGISITLSFIFICLLFLPLNKEFLLFLTGLIIIFFIGIVDDLKHINHYLKFTGEIAASLIFLIFNGTVIFSFGDLVGTGPLSTGIFALPISVFCMVGVMNALNMADGLDGLAGGISAIACLFLGYFAYTSGQSVYFYMLIIMLGCLAGFLYFNKHPARIFMGDTGSLVLGYVLSAICILLVQNTGNEISVLPVSMAIVMGLPIVDALLVMTLRAIKGINPFLPDNTHLHHRLLSLGLQHKSAVILMYFLMILCGLLAILVVNLPEWVQFYTGVAVATTIFGTIYLLQRTYGNIKYQNSGHE